MHAEIIMIGTELLLGQIVDTNAAFLGQALAENGVHLYQKTTVGDNPVRIREALAAALNRSDVVLTSGGLGPTEDDITRECVAELLDRPLALRQDLLDELTARFAHFRFELTENNKKQAMAPEGALAVENPRGTAPGLIVEDERGTIVCMPGVPRELETMVTDRILPYLRAKRGDPGVVHSRVLHVCGMGESHVDAAIGDLIVSQQNPTVGVLASPGAVRIRITAQAPTVDEANALIDPVDDAVRLRLPGLVLDAGDATLEEAVDRLLTARGWRLAVAETLSGGTLARRLTVAGAACFAGATVFPAGAPGQPALEMAEAIRVQYNVVCGLATATGSESERTDVAFVSPEGAGEWTLGYARSDARSQTRTSVLALEWVRRHLTGTPDPDN